MSEIVDTERGPMRVEWDVPITMSDAIVLRADVFRPLGDRPVPVLLSSGPYGKGLAFQEGYSSAWQQLVGEHPEVAEGSSNRFQSWEVADPERWVPLGYACVRVDSRGVGRSPGYLDSFSEREIQVEVWPTSLVLRPGYRLAVAVQGHDYEYGDAGPERLSNIKGELRASGPFLHDDLADRPALDPTGSMPDANVTLYTGAATPVTPDRCIHPPMTSTRTGPLRAHKENQVILPSRFPDVEIQFIDEIPKSATGKILRKDLRGMSFASLQRTFGLEDTESTSRKQKEVSR